MSASLPNSQGVKPLEVFALSTAQLSHPDRWLFEDGDADLMKARHPYPDYAFLIKHHSGKNVLFDLGLRKDLENVPKVVQGGFPWVEPVVAEDAVEILAKGNMSPADIHAVIFSHLHFDHVGDCTKFPNSEMVAGPGSRAVSSPGFPVDPKSPFESSLIDHPKYREISFESDAWAGPFSGGHDFFGDGSLFLVDTPGHMAGHLGALALTGPGEWVFMGGDCCHHRSLLVGSRPMSTTIGPIGMKGFHKDPDVAQETIAKIRLLERTGHVFIALAHDSYLVDSMPQFPGVHLNGWSSSNWRKDLDTVLARDYSK